MDPEVESKDENENNIEDEDDDPNNYRQIALYFLMKDENEEVES